MFLYTKWSLNSHIISFSVTIKLVVTIMGGKMHMIWSTRMYMCNQKRSKLMIGEEE